MEKLPAQLYLLQITLPGTADKGELLPQQRPKRIRRTTLALPAQPQKPADAWFYQLLQDKRDFHLYINPDAVLDVTKLWIDVLVRDGDRVLAVVGPASTSKPFYITLVDIGQPGITSLFVDAHGAHPTFALPSKLIDFASFVKPEGQKKTLALLLDDPDEQQRRQATMQRLAQLHINRTARPKSTPTLCTCKASATCRAWPTCPPSAEF